MTSCMSSKRSNQLSYASATVYIISHKNGNCKPFFEFFQKYFFVGRSIAVQYSSSISKMRSDASCKDSLSTA